MPKSRKSIILIITAFIFSVSFQYLMFFLEKSVYLGSFLIILVVMLFLYMGFRELQILILDSLFLVTVILLMMVGNPYFANYIIMNFIILTLSVVPVYLVRHKLNKPDFIYGNIKKVLKYLLISLCVVFISLIYFIDNSETADVILRIRNPEIYYRKVDTVIIDGVEYKNNVKVNIDIPEENAKVSGLFYIQGWAGDVSEIEDARIGSIYAFLNNKPQEGGKFLGIIDIKKRREDVVKVYGEKYKDSGYYFEIDSKRLNNGLNTIYVYAKSNYFGWNYTWRNIYVEN